MSHYYLDMQNTIKKIATKGKGILAADESIGTIGKRFAKINVENTEENRRFYRELLMTTKDLEKYISGIILFEETLKQKTADGVLFIDVLKKKGIIPGIKVDQGLIPFESSLDEKTTEGLDGLPARLESYKKAGAKFAKWRVVFEIDEHKPSNIVIRNNTMLLARYAKMCQNIGIVPIVEPEVLMDGSHSLEQCATVSEKVFAKVFRALSKYKVSFEHMILKPSMVVAGKEFKIQPTYKAAAIETLKILKRTIPAAVPTINFLSGGQTDEAATEHLKWMNKLEKTAPWNLSFSYGRALQDACLKTWKGEKKNIKKAQDALLKRAKENGQATQGK